MTDIDKAWAYLRQTKTAGANLKVWPPTDKNSKWYQAGVELGVIVAGPPPPPPPTGSFGADLRAAFPPLTGGQVIDDAGKPARTSRVYVVGSNQHYKHVRRVGGNEDGFKLTNGASNIRFDLCESRDLGNVRAMAWSFQPGNGGANSRNIQIYGGVNHSFGLDNREHIAYLGAGCRDILLAGVLGYDQTGYGSHVYPGPANHIVHANCTFVDSRIRSGVIIQADSGPIDDVLYVNCIIEGVEYTSGTRIVFDTCCLYGNVERHANITYRNCIFENPGLDAQYKPSNPKLVNGGLAGWVPPWDCRGNAYTKATIGAVAA